MRHLTYGDYRAWIDATYPEGNVTSGRFDDDAMRDAFEAGYKLAADRPVCIAREVVAHEYDMVLGVYSTREFADAAVAARKKLDIAKWVDEWPVDEVQLDTDLTRF